MRARRALLYVPGDDLHKIQKSITLDVDTICLDLEDGVAQNRKQVARETISKALSSLDFSRSECLVRTNPPGSQNFELDLQEILPGQPDGIVLPKVTGGEQILHTNEIISSIETEYGWPPGAIILVAIVESAQAVVNLESIASSHSRLEALIFGAEDFAATIGAKRSTPGWEVFFARSAVVTYSAAHDLQAIDMVNINYQDMDDLRTQSEQGARMGFSGKQVIHPNQVEIVQAAFTPTSEEIQEAIELIENFRLHETEGRGAFGLEGIMIDAPAIKIAQATLNRASAAGVLTHDQLSRLQGELHE